MLFSKGVAVIALALLHLTSAAPTIDSAVLLQERDPNQVGLTNGERISRGLGVNKPKRLFGETKTLHGKHSMIWRVIRLTDSPACQAVHRCWGLYNL